MSLVKPHLSDKPTLIRFGVLGLLCLGASVAYLCRNSIGVAESTIRQELKLSEVEMGRVMSCFFLAYALGQIPMGWLAKRLGSRRAISLFAVAWSAATALMSVVATAPLLILSRATNGLGQAGLFPAATATIGKWFPAGGRAVASGALASCMSIGGAVGVAMTGVLISRFGWQATFIAYGQVGLVFAVGFYWLFRDTPAEHPRVNDAERQLIAGQPTKTAPEAAGDWLRIYLSPATWWICGQQFCRAAGQIFFSSWFATYLQQTRGVTVAESGLLNSLPLVGIVVGALVGGSLSDYVLLRTGSRRWARSGVAVFSMTLCALFVLAAYFIASPVGAVIAISLGTFCAATGGPCAYTTTIDMGGRNVSILFATMNMIGNLGAFWFIGVVPQITARTGWDGVLIVFALLYFAAAAFWLLINPSGDILDQSLIRSRDES